MDDHVLTDTFFESFPLHPLLQQGLADCGFSRCTPIQALTLPVALKGRDVAGQAQTGTGKTCAFLVALMNQLLQAGAKAERKDHDPRALVVAPTRELAIQIDKDAQAIGAHTGLQIALIYGGVDYEKQRQMLRDGCDIIIATPGRLIDYYKQHVFRLDSVEVMVVDEADRMFDLGFIRDIRYIFHHLAPRDERQVLLYSATLSQRVLELAYEHMNDAEKLVVEADHVTADSVRQCVYFPAREEKLPLLLNLLAREKPTRSIVFVNTRAQAERLRDHLRRYGYRIGLLSGNVPQDKRQKTLRRFKENQLEMLVCTDVAARGLHIPHVSHVFNYDLPQDAEDYVHRIGRTARLGEEGDAISFACDLYAMSLPDIEQYIEQKIPVASIEPELLVMPKPPQLPAKQSDNAQADTSAKSGKRKRRRRKPRTPAGDVAAHDGEATKRDEAKQGQSDSVKQEGGGNRDGYGEKNGGAPGTSSRRRRRRRRRNSGSEGKGGGSAGVSVDQVRAANRAPDATHEQTPSPKRRRRRGGNRNHQGQGADRAATRPATTGQQAAPAPGKQPHAEPKPSSRQAETTRAARPVSPSPSAAKPARRGFFKRLINGLTGNHR